MILSSFFVTKSRPTKKIWKSPPVKLPVVEDAKVEEHVEDKIDGFIDTLTNEKVEGNFSFKSIYIDGNNKYFYKK